jgi:urea transport system permease protein
LFALGGLFIVVTLFMPRGILGAVGDLWERSSQKLRAVRSPKPLTQAAE